MLWTNVFSLYFSLSTIDFSNPDLFKIYWWKTFLVIKNILVLFYNFSYLLGEIKLVKSNKL